MRVTNSKLSKEQIDCIVLMVQLGFLEIRDLIFTHPDLPTERFDISAIHPKKIVLFLFQKFTKLGEQNFKKKLKELLDIKD